MTTLSMIVAAKCSCTRPLLLLLLVLFHTTATAAASSSYTAITALDKYGNSIQLQHAQQAAKMHGTPMVAAMAVDGIVVVSLALGTRRLGIITTDNSNVMQSLSLYNNNNPNNNNNNNNNLAMICTGVKADAKWLIQNVREYQKRQWETYDLPTMNMHKCQEAISQLLLQFMGYSREKEFNDGMVIDTDSDASSSSWSRPMGVQTLLLSSSSQSHKQNICLMDPSGTVIDCTAQAIGRHSADIHTKLEESKYDSQNMSMDDVQELLVGIVRDVFDLDASANDIVVERLTSNNGIERQVGPTSSQSQA
jgi:20S proteasome alpha/beta subunit